MKTIISQRIADDASAAGDIASSLPGVRIQKSISVQRMPAELYALWKQFELWPQFMTQIDRVEKLGNERFRWHAKGKKGGAHFYDTILIDDIPNEVVSWRSYDTSDIRNTGAIVFKPGAEGRGTIVTAKLTYEPVGGALGDKIAALFGSDPQQQVSEDLRRFKAIAETGEVPTAERS